MCVLVTGFFFWSLANVFCKHCKELKFKPCLGTLRQGLGTLRHFPALLMRVGSLPVAPRWRRKGTGTRSEEEG
jgi:hypothetical protein